MKLTFLSSGHTPEKILGAIHFGDTWPDNVHYSESLLTPVSWADDFHVYALEWRPGEIRWFVDGKEYGRVTPKDIAPYPWVFDERPFYLILNLALGGTLGGKIKKSDLPGELIVDYVRVHWAVTNTSCRQVDADTGRNQTYLFGRNCMNVIVNAVTHRIAQRSEKNAVAT